MSWQFQHTAARRRLDVRNFDFYRVNCFNTQPPEGGWRLVERQYSILFEFQHTAARRRLLNSWSDCLTGNLFQHTAARRRLTPAESPKTEGGVSTHSRPKAAGRLRVRSDYALAFQHTAARRRLPFLPTYHKRVSCFNTQPPEGGWSLDVYF